jgi:class 3 adenylate cyclase
MNQRHPYLLLLFCLLPLLGLAQINIEAGWESEYVEQKSKVLSLQSATELNDKEVVAGRHDARFVSFQEGYTSGKETYHWFKLTVQNNSTQNQVLYLGTTRFEHLQFWLKTDSTTIGPLLNGQLVPLPQKHVAINGLSFFKFDLAQGQEADIYLKAINQNASILPQQITPLTLASEPHFRNNYEKAGDYTYIFIGAIGIMFLFNLLLFFTTHLRVYFYYSSYVFWVAIFAIGLIPQFAYPLYGNMDVNLFPMATGGTASTMFYVLVGGEIMEIKKYYPKIKRFLDIILWLFAVPLITGLFPNLATVTAILNFVLASLAFPSIFIVCFLMVLKGHSSSKIFFVAVLIFVTGAMTLILSLLNILPPVIFRLPIINFYQVCVLGELAFFALGIGGRINEMKHLKAQEAIERLRADQLVAEKEQTRKLLLNTLPESTVDELMQNGKVSPRFHQNVSILFIDIVDFTKYTEKFSPDELIKDLDYYYGAFDSVIQKYNLEKIKTIGDAYLAVCGVPQLVADNAHQTIRAAKEILAFVEAEKQNHQRLGKDFFEVRIGVHTGDVIAGVVGTIKFAYDIWGDSVNTAARMEQNSEPGKINISEATYALIQAQIECTYRGKINAKNKGKIDMYFVN